MSELEKGLVNGSYITKVVEATLENMHSRGIDIVSKFKKIFQEHYLLKL